jgi:hypothetical protein
VPWCRDAPLPAIAWFDSIHVVPSPVMGAVACELHGIQLMAMTSSAVARAVLANERWTRRALVRVRTELWDDQEPRARCWFDRATAGDRDDELLPASVVLELADDAVCVACFNAWLAENGIDNAHSPDELRFVRIAEALENAMRPTLEARFTTMMNALVSWEGPSGMGFSTLRGRPFTAYVSSHIGRVVSLAVHDRGDHLVASIEVFPEGVVMPEALQVALVSAELDESALAALAAWSDAVAEALGRVAYGNTISG